MRRSPRDPVVELLWDAYWTHPSADLRNLLVEEYQALVRRSVRCFGARLPRAVDRGDLIAVANVGLMAAVAGFDPSRNVPFEAYAERRIRGALVDELRRQDWLPRQARARLETRRRAIDALRAATGREPDDSEVARAVGLSLARYEALYGRAGSGEVWRGRTGRGSRDSATPEVEVVPDTHGDEPDERMSRDELVRVLSRRLSQSEYRVLYLRYWVGLPMQEIGRLIHLSASRVCKIHAKLLGRMKGGLGSRAI